MSNLEQLPDTLGKINQDLAAFRAETDKVRKNLLMLPGKTLFSVISEDLTDASLQFDNSVFAPDSETETQALSGLKKAVANPSAEKLRQQRPIQLEQRGWEVGQQVKNRQLKIGQLKNISSSALSFAQPKLALAQNFLKPGADLEAGLADVQSVLGLKNDDPHVAALREQSLSMAASGHSPADVVAKQQALAKKGMNADQVLAQTPAALNGATPAAQMAVTVKGDNLDGDITKLFASWDTLRINLFDGQSAALRELTQTATRWLSTVNTWITDNPVLVNSLLGLALGITGIIGGMGALGMTLAPVLSGINMLMAGAGLLGTIFTGTGGVIAAAFAALGLPLLPVIALIAGIGIAVVKLWEPVSAFVGGVIEGFTAVVGPVGDAFAPFRTALGWITDLFEPIQFTQSTLSGFTDIGKQVGEVIGEILASLNRAVTQIGEVFSWAKKGWDAIFGNDEDEHPDIPASPVESISPTGGTLSLYQPAKTSVANNLTDNRATTVNLSFTATPETDHNQIRTWIEDSINQQKWNDTNNLLSQYNNGGIYS
ncbi:phage tail tape measure protein [Rahnella woolbedingensis]|uniref:Phage tail tape measure protein n=1 Tax=Rahnella woolbedingensis TaxID=1510574 RepID=A0A419N4U8_9GAMM|nr:phage tail tape measure protein [Rahnella woolbedingensis]RJT40503.1 phage tail tape measure protein [Rahnella woolbedingensis]